MSLIVENGSSLTNAESYASVADADAFHAARGNSDWDALGTVAKEQALRLATDHMHAAYRLRWKGYRTHSSQALDWPRVTVAKFDGAIPDGYGNSAFYLPDDMPTEVKRACMMLAAKVKDGDLMADLDQAIASESVGPISTTYVQGSKRTRTYSAVDALLAPLLKSSGRMAIIRG